MVVVALDAFASSPIRLHQGYPEAPVGVRAGIGYFCKCLTTVPARLPGENSLAAASS